MNNKRFNIFIEIAIVFLFLILSILLIFKEQICNLDEIWQYNFAKNIIENKIPYKDFSIIVTPLYPFLASIFLKILGNEFFVMRIFNSLLLFGILYCTYNILKLLKVNRKINLLIIFIMYMFFYGIIEIEYNCLVLFLTLLLIYFEILFMNKNKENMKICNFSLGLIVGLIILTKHTIGCFIAVAFIICKLMDYKKYKSKELIVLISSRVMGLLFPVIIFLIYLIYNNCFYDFINYCLLGIKEFSTVLPYNYLFTVQKKLVNIFSFIIPIGIVLLPIVYFYINKRKQIHKLYKIIYIYSLIMLMGIFPIIDEVHFVVFSYVFIVYLFIITYKFLENKINKLIEKYSIQIDLLLVVYVFLLFFMFKNTISTYQNNIKADLKHFKNIPISIEMYNEIKNIDNYINTQKIQYGKKVYVLDSSAALYMIPLDIYNKDYDMFNKGNFGKNGETRIIQNIKEESECQYLLLKNNYLVNEQTPTNIIEYVKNNKIKVGEISVYDIYE